MLEPWNDASILAPPILTVEVTSLVDTERLRYICKEIISVLSKQSPLHKESAILSRFIYKFDKKFRNDIGYRILRKVNTALRKYLTLNILKEVESFKSILPGINSNESYLPSRQMLQYLMVRLQTFSKIMIRVCVTAKQAAVFYLDRIKRGEGHWMSLMPYAALCRLWSLCTVLVNHSCHWYNLLVSFVTQLQPKGLPFLPDNYELPADLANWLDVKHIDELGKFDWAENKSIEVLSILTAIDDHEDSFDIFKYVSEINDDDTGIDPNIKGTEIKAEIDPVISARESDVKNCTQPQKLNMLPQKVERGEKLSRDTFKNLCEKNEILVKETSKKGLKPEKGEKISRDTFKNVCNQNEHFIEESTNKVEKVGTGQKICKGTEMLRNESTNKAIYISNKTVHKAESVTSSDSLKTFVINEETFRNEDDKKSLTRHLSFMQWQALKTSLLRLCDNKNNRKIQRKFEKLWNDKCLQYKE